jgi:hypothetical protein
METISNQHSAVLSTTSGLASFGNTVRFNVLIAVHHPFVYNPTVSLITIAIITINSVIKRENENQEPQRTYLQHNNDV